MNDSFEAIQQWAELLGKKINSIDDVPKLTEAMEAWGLFETAKMSQRWYEAFKLRILQENYVRDTTISEKE